MKLPGNLPSLQVGFLTPLIPYEPYLLKCTQTRVTIVTKIADLPSRDARICIDFTFDRGRRDVKLTCLKPAAGKSTHFTKIVTIAIWLAKCKHSSKTFIQYHLYNHTRFFTPDTTNCNDLNFKPCVRRSGKFEQITHKYQNVAITAYLRKIFHVDS